ncbi:MAG TPA: sn-glycerol-3-phosphate ABC transporter ATP-binding protein UgpC [Conexibacter sp.]|nr:sn-glycerol-3-phosphate ABC transporter ATP-binding protein UgpC [Conexibacter sp.]
MASITLEEITKRYPDDTLAVDRLSLEVADGEFMVLVGPSGCGKSTALRMIAGLEDISGGVLKIGDEVVNHVDARDRDIAMVFQNYALYPHMSVRENMAFALKLAKVDRATIAQKVQAAAEVLDLTEHLERRPSSLSGGQRQRVAMGRAIVREPAAFLMDEPLSNLDAKLRVQMRTEITRLQQRLGTTTVFVTHDQIEAMTLGDRITVMRGGVVQQIGAPAELYANPCNAFVAGFIGSPAMNFLPAGRTATGVELDLGESRVNVPGIRFAADAPERIVAGIRPEHLEDAACLPEAQREVGIAFPVTVDVIENVGSDAYAYIRLGAAGSVEADPLGVQSGQLVARLTPATRAAAGMPLELWLDPANLRIFDGETGAHVSTTSSARALVA